MRLDGYVAQYWPEYSRSVWQKYIVAGFVQVNGTVETSVKRALGEDDEVTIHLPALDTSSTLDIPIIYEDDHVIVMNKPTGILTHAKGAVSDELTVADFIRPHITDIPPTNRSGIVHRLDRDTSGIIIAAKDQTTLGMLQKQFQDRRAKKTYLAIVDGHPKENKAHIDLPIERNPKQPSTFRVGPRGKSATTDYTVLAVSDTQSLVEMKPTTGRTHQLRVHMAYIGTPIAGDKLYGHPKPKVRLMLHAASLEITIPEGDRRTFEAPVPDDMKEASKDFEKL